VRQAGPYRRAAEWAHLEGQSALNPYERDLLLNIERSFQRLAEAKERESQRLAELKDRESVTESDSGAKEQNERHFAFFKLFDNWGR